MSRKRKQPSRRRKGSDPNRAGRARPSPGGEPALSLAGATFSGETSLVPVSCTFHDPDTAVTTYEVRLPAEDGRARGSLPAALTVVKACKQEHAIEHYPTVRASRLGFFREDRSSLVWDMQEGVVTHEPRTEQRHNDPADLEEQRQIDAEMARSHPLNQATTRVSATRVSVTQTQESSLALGDNCLIYCTAIEPRNSSEWSLLEESFKEEGYDHFSRIYQPHMFARALGLMAHQQEGLLGNPIVFRHPDNGNTAQCRNLPVVYGPIVYVRDRNEYLQRSMSEVEFVIRCIFAKAIGDEFQNTYQHQREYRFAILAARRLDYPTLDLTTSAEMRETMKLPPPRQTTRRRPSVQVGECLPSPRILRCLSGWPSSQASAPHGGIALSSQLQGSFPIKGTQHQNVATTRQAVQTVEIDRQIVERAIELEPRSPTDSRIVKFTLEGGTKNTLRFYDLEGINGTHRLVKESGVMRVKASITRPEGDQIKYLIDATDFDGTFNLNHEPRQIILAVTTMNPSATVVIDPPDAAPDLPGHRVGLSETEDTQITVTATSEDGSTTSGFTISIDRDLYVATTLADSSGRALHENP